MQDAILGDLAEHWCIPHQKIAVLCRLAQQLAAAGAGGEQLSAAFLEDIQREDEYFEDNATARVVGCRDCDAIPLPVTARS